MLVSDILTRVQRTFGDESGAQVDLGDVIRWTNDAQTEIAKANRLLQVTATINTVAGTASYLLSGLPSPILDLQVARYDGHTLRGIAKEEADALLADRTAANAGTGTPAVFWAWANSIYLYPTPNAVKVLSIDFTRIPVAVVAAGDTPELPTRWHTRIVDYCLAQAYLLDDNQAAYERAIARFERRVADEKEAADWSPQDVYPYMTVAGADADYWGYW
jgi:hypothetical protein